MPLFSFECGAMEIGERINMGMQTNLFIGCAYDYSTSSGLTGSPSEVIIVSYQVPKKNILNHWEVVF